jgi:hypothetical protein
LRINERGRTIKTFFQLVADLRRNHSPKSQAFKQHSLIFVGCIDFLSRDDEIAHPIGLWSDRGICKGIDPIGCLRRETALKCHEASSWAQ